LVPHVVPAVHATHALLALHTMFVPQLVPVPLGVESTQVVVPVEHDVTPVKQAAEGFVEQATPAIHAPQEPPLSQTAPEPHEVPAAFAMPSTHVVAPVEHDVTPLKHSACEGFVVHDWPAVHETHAAALLQTRFDPQLVPGALGASSTQVEVPVAHDVTPEAHALFGFVEQATPALHVAHWPLALQTSFVPHEVPAAFLVPSTQADAPDAQEVTPL
jgi:hypothetical protein